jgi:predicted enzyme related to lactoylglutathione lyase
MGNGFVHVELNTQDLPGAREFYQQLFDWDLSEKEMGPTGPYVLIDTKTEPGGGMLEHPRPGAPSFWLPYVQVDDLRAATDKAKGLGATIIRDNYEVPDWGFLSIFTDPTGATLGLWKPK